MAIVKPFKGVRPPKEFVEQVESRPYDVLNSEEAREEAKGNEKSLYHIIKPEIDFTEGTSEYDPRVYEKAAENFKKFQDKGWLVQDEKEQYYIYAQTMNDKTQYGIVVGAACQDYVNGVIKKHELTRRDKEEDRMKHVRVNDAKAAAGLVGGEKAKANPNHTGKEEYNYFMAVCFQASELTILDYNRVVKDLNGMSSEEFLKALAKNFIVEKKGTAIYKPAKLHEFSLYLDGEWYALTAKEGTYDNSDPIGVLDVDISSRLILDELLGIKDLRSSDRIDFVGGLRGLEELKKRVDSGEMRVALALYPVSMQQIMDIADSGKIMPPKATWFEPKLRSGLIIHKLS